MRIHCPNLLLNGWCEQVIRRLTLLIWEAALPPCLCAIVTVATYITLVRAYFILGIIYSHSSAGQRELLGLDVPRDIRQIIRHLSVCHVVRNLNFGLLMGPLTERCGIFRNGRQELQNAPTNGISTNRISNIVWSSPIHVEVS